jgi:hypothetical protein
MVQLKITAQKREYGKGNADVGNKGGTKTSSLAAASALSPAVSALSQSSSSKPPSKRKVGTIAGSRKDYYASRVAGPTDKRSRGEGKAAGSASKPESTQKTEVEKGMNMGDDRESIKAKQADPQDTSSRIGKDVLSQARDQAVKRLESLAKERESMSTHSSSSLSIKELEPTLGEDTEEISATSLMKCDSVEGVLGQNKIYTTGTFNINRHEVDEEIKQGGVQVTSNIKEADLIVVGNNPSEREMVYLKGRSIPQINLELLYKVLQAEIPLSSIMDTPGKVSFASSTIGIQRGDSSSSKSVSKYGFPRRIPKGRIDKVGDREGTSRSSSAAASALSHNSLSKPMIQGEGGTKASSRKGDRATDIIDGKGRIDNVGDREVT